MPCQGYYSLLRYRAPPPPSIAMQFLMEYIPKFNSQLGIKLCTGDAHAQLN